MNIKDYPNIILKSEVAHQIMPHLPSRYAWQKIKTAVGDDPTLRAAFNFHRHYLYISEYQYLMKIV